MGELIREDCSECGGEYARVTISGEYLTAECVGCGLESYELVAEISGGAY